MRRSMRNRSVSEDETDKTVKELEIDISTPDPLKGAYARKLAWQNTSAHAPEKH